MTGCLTHLQGGADGHGPLCRAACADPAWAIRRCAAAPIGADQPQYRLRSTPRRVRGRRFNASPVEGCGRPPLGGVCRFPRSVSKLTRHSRGGWSPCIASPPGRNCQRNPRNARTARTTTITPISQKMLYINRERRMRAPVPAMTVE